MHILTDCNLSLL